MITIGSNAASTKVSNILNTLTDSIEKQTKILSSGKRILSAEDDPAGIAIATSIRTDRESYSVVEKKY